jgi:hypothetical protein
MKTPIGGLNTAATGHIAQGEHAADALLDGPAGAGAHHQIEMQEVHAAAAVAGTSPSEALLGAHQVLAQPRNLAAMVSVAVQVDRDAAALEAQNTHAIAQLPARDQKVVREVQESLRQIVFGTDSRGRLQAAQDAHPELRALATQVAEDLNRLDEARAAGGLPRADEIVRQTRAGNVLVRLLRNEGEGDHERRAGNLINAVLRAGVSTAVGTFARNTAAFAINQIANAANKAASEVAAAATSATTEGGIGSTLASHVASIWSVEEATKLLNAVGLAALGVSLALQVAGALRDARSGAGTRETAGMRVAQTALTIGLSALNHGGGNWGTMATLYATVGVYSMVRGVATTPFRLQDNVTALSGRALAINTGVYAGAQIAGNIVQNAAGLSGGPFAQAISPREHSSQEIATASQPLGLNAGHAVLNAALEVVDEVQIPYFHRRANVQTRAGEIRAMGPDEKAAFRAAALHAMIEHAHVNPDADREALREAAMQGTRHYAHAELEGLRMSLARTAPSRESVRDTAQRSVDGLARIGLRFHQAPQTEAEHANNRLISAYVAQDISRLEMNQALELGTTQGMAGRLRNNLVNQFANIEAHRQQAFFTVFNVLVGSRTSVSAQQVPNTAHREGVNNLTESLALGGAIAGIYPLFISGVAGRGPTTEATMQRQERAAEVRRITEGAGRTIGHTVVVGHAIGNGHAPSNGHAADGFAV